MVFADRYVNNGDGTITDTKTGLVWQKANDGIDRTLPDARTYCAGLSLGGHQDWRVPRIDELETIIDYGRYDTSLDPLFNHNGSIYGYWPDTQTQYSQEYFWAVSFDDGYVGYTYERNGLYVRCVRGGPYWSLDTSRRLEVFDEAIVKDTLNFKMWQKSDGGLPRTWDQANQYCNQLTIGGYADWRLPSIEELESIIDYTSIPAISGMFNHSNKSGGNYWSATPYVNDPTLVWIGNFTYGVVFGAPSNDGGGLYFRCVRDDTPFFLTATVSPPGSGVVTKNPDRAIYYSYGEVVTLTAKASPGYKFRNWTRDGEMFPDRKSSKNNSIQIHVDGDMSLIAHFHKIGGKK
jgi:hypothetical protein